MQGSLDNPPIIVRSSRWKTAWSLFAMIVVAGLGIFGVLHPPSQRAWGSWLLLVLGVTATPLYAWKLCVPDTLQLGPDGLTSCIKPRIRFYAWRDARNFRVKSWFGSRQIVPRKTVVFDGPLNKGGQESFIDLGNSWELDNAALADLLNAARDKWGRRN